MSVTASLTTRDRQLATWIGEHTPFENPFLLVAALRKAEIKPQTALALESKEGGRNIFGCDWPSPQGRDGRAPFCHQRVTEARYRALRKLGKPNGVGPVQLTSFGLCDRADRRGGCWKPYYSRWTGYEHLRDLIRAHGYENGANRYNGGDSDEGQRNGAAAHYGPEFVAFREQWERKLRAAGFHV
jgi:hypothetical protein